MKGVKTDRIAAAFGQARQTGSKVFIPYIMAGDPSLDVTFRQVLMLEQCGADIIELGVPFSDPVADGPTIQRAAERSLAAGTTLRKVLPFVRRLREVTQIPLILMTYYNIIYHYGERQFVLDALEAGVDGVIIPDLPPEEAAGFIACAKAGREGRRLATIFLVAPTSTEKRVRAIARASAGFVYYVSMTGITGSPLQLEQVFTSHIRIARTLTEKPLAVGFGVSGAEDARKVGQYADGVIVGSALVRVFHERPEAAEAFIKELREAI